MSWDPYIDNLIEHTSGACDQACIIGVDGSKWTTDSHQNALIITPTEAAAVGKALNTTDYSTFQASGIMIQGVKYQFLRGDDTMVLGKKKDKGAITMQKSKTAIVIGHTKEGASQGNTNKGVGTIAEYLEGLGM